MEVVKKGDGGLKRNTLANESPQSQLFQPLFFDDANEKEAGEAAFTYRGWITF